MKVFAKGQCAVGDVIIDGVDGEEFTIIETLEHCFVYEWMGNIHIETYRKATNDNWTFKEEPEEERFHACGLKSGCNGEHMKKTREETCTCLPFSTETCDVCVEPEEGNKPWYGGKCYPTLQEVVDAMEEPEENPYAQQESFCEGVRKVLREVEIEEENELIDSFKPNTYKPVEGEYFYCVSDSGYADQHTWSEDSAWCQRLYEAGNVYRLFSEALNTKVRVLKAYKNE